MEIDFNAKIAIKKFITYSRCTRAEIPLQASSHREIFFFAYHLIELNTAASSTIKNKSDKLNTENSGTVKYSSESAISVNLFTL